MISVHSNREINSVACKLTAFVNGYRRHESIGNISVTIFIVIERYKVVKLNRFCKFNSKTCDYRFTSSVDILSYCLEVNNSNSITVFGYLSSECSSSLCPAETVIYIIFMCYCTEVHSCCAIVKKLTDLSPISFEVAGFCKLSAVFNDAYLLCGTNLIALTIQILKSKYYIRHLRSDIADSELVLVCTCKFILIKDKLFSNHTLCIRIISLICNLDLTVFIFSADNYSDRDVFAKSQTYFGNRMTCYSVVIASLIS